jgi:hypothetical protein
LVKRAEILSEKSISFRRVYFFEGFIDIYFGSSDPNSGEESSPVAFYRLNGEGEWAPKGSFLNLEKRMSELHSSAEDIWKKSLVCTKNS